MTAAEVIYRRLRPLARIDPAHTEVLEALVAAIAEPFEDTWSVVEGDETRAPWETALDPAETPAGWLPWLAQFPGVQLPPSADEAEQRRLIGQAAGFYRGTRRAIREDVQLTLTGDKFVLVIARGDGGRWNQAIITRTSETPAPAATLAAAAAQKPAGVIQLVIDTDVWVIGEIEVTYHTIGELEADFATIGDLETHEP